MTMAKQWTGKKQLGLAAAMLAATGIPAAALVAQETAAPAAAPAPVDNARVAKGRELYANWGCGSCHALADAQARGDVGPALDGGHLTYDFVVSRVTHGQGAMPSFAGQLSDEEIADIAYYITKVAKTR